MPQLVRGRSYLAMLCVVLMLLVSALTARCRGDGGNSSLSPAAPRSAAVAHARALRRQLTRDNYDYQQSAGDGQPSGAASSGGDTKFHYQKGRTYQLPRASKLAQANSNELSAESDQQEHYKQRYQLEQRGQHEQGRQYKQNGEYEHSDQYEQPGEYEQRGQNHQRDHYQQYGPPEQRGPRKLHGKHQEREQREKRGQNEHSDQRKQLEQFDEQEQGHSIEQEPRAVPSLDDVPVAASFTDELTVRDVIEHEYTPDRREIDPEQNEEYNSSYYNKLRDEYDAPHPTQKPRRPFSDLRGTYDMRAQDLASHAQESPDQEYDPDEQEAAFDQQDDSGSQDDEASDFSLSKMQPKIYSYLVTHRATRANRFRYYTPAPAERHTPPHRNAPPPHHLDHNISKKDLLYYVDDNQLRRRNNDAFSVVPDEDQPANDQLFSPQPSPGRNNPADTRTSPDKPARQPAPNEGSSEEELPRTARARRSFVVTVSAANVTYKLLTLRSRSGRRQDGRRILEERGPHGVAIMSLDHAPLPAFRLPRARRQYMHAPHQRRHHQTA